MPLLAKGQRFIMIECPCCGASTQYVTMVAVTKPHDHEAPLSLPASTMRGMGRLDRCRSAAVLGLRRVRQLLA
jgi:hypothetical protein